VGNVWGAVLAHFAQAGLYEREVKLRCGPRSFRITRHDRVKNGGMLFVEDWDVLLLPIEQIARKV